MTVTAPDVSVWWDATATTAAALAQLRLTDADVDAARVGALVDPAGQIINQFLDRDPADPLPTPPPPQLDTDIVTVVVNLYRAKDQPAASIDGMMFGAVPPSYVDPLASVRATLRPFKSRFGVG